MKSRDNLRTFKLNIFTVEPILVSYGIVSDNRVLGGVSRWSGSGRQREEPLTFLKSLNLEAVKSHSVAGEEMDAPTVCPRSYKIHLRCGGSLSRRAYRRS